jgi:predicted MPP superfamily phosphohydrolase
MAIRIAHIADVHVRNISRHQEYKAVFIEFVKQCKLHCIDHIYIGGDVFHTKCSGMSPECIEFMCWMFNTLSLVADVHVTLGNHDMNLANLTRQDAISPIVAALNNPKVHLYKNSGVYEFAAGYVFGVFSLFDSNNWSIVKPVEGKINIACYHGPVRGALSETEWLIDEGVTTDFFDGWDFVMLGDIHKLQYLAHRDVELEIDECDLSKYPGAEVIG